MVVVSVHQPNFMPWLKLLGKILDSDVYVAYDSVQFTRQEFHARQRFMARNGTAEWLTVPVVSTGSRQILCDVRVADNGWRQKHLDFLAGNYSSAPFFEEVFDLISTVYERDHDSLVTHSVDLIEQFCRYLGSDVKIVRATDLHHEGSREERLLQLVQHAGGDVHLTSTSSTHVIDWEGFFRAGIPVYMQEFDHPSYSQPAQTFIQNLSAVDLLFNTGREAARLLKQCSRERLIAASESRGSFGASVTESSDAMRSQVATHAV